MTPTTAAPADIQTLVGYLIPQLTQQLQLNENADTRAYSGLTGYLDGNPTLAREAYGAAREDALRQFSVDVAQLGLSQANLNFQQRVAEADTKLQELSTLAQQRGPKNALAYNYLLNNGVVPQGTAAGGSSISGGINQPYTTPPPSSAQQTITSSAQAAPAQPGASTYSIDGQQQAKNPFGASPTGAWYSSSPEEYAKAAAAVGNTAPAAPDQTPGYTIDPNGVNLSAGEIANGAQWHAADGGMQMDWLDGPDGRVRDLAAAMQWLPREADGGMSFDVNALAALLAGGANSGDVNALLGQAMREQQIPRPVQAASSSLAPPAYQQPAYQQPAPLAARDYPQGPMPMEMYDTPAAPAPLPSGGSWGQEDTAGPREGWQPQVTSSAQPASAQPTRMRGNSTPVDLIRALAQYGPSLGQSQSETDQQNRDVFGRVAGGAMAYPGTGGAVAAATERLGALAGLFRKAPAAIDYGNFTGVSPYEMNGFIKSALGGAPRQANGGITMPRHMAAGGIQMGSPVIVGDPKAGAPTTPNVEMAAPVMDGGQAGMAVMPVDKMAQSQGSPAYDEGYQAQLQGNPDPQRMQQDKEYLAGVMACQAASQARGGQQQSGGMPMAADGGVFSNTVYSPTDIANAPSLQKLAGNLGTGFGQTGLDYSIPGAGGAGIPQANRANITTLSRMLPSELGFTQGVVETPREMGGLGLDWGDYLAGAKRSAPTGGNFSGATVYG